MGLILDFVSNQVAPDHPETSSKPQLFVTGTAAELGKIIVHGDLVTQTLMRRDEYASRPPRLDSGARESQRLCGDPRPTRSAALGAGTPAAPWRPLGHPAHQGPLCHPVQEGKRVTDLHSVLALACDRHAHHLPLQTE
jgi:hypothetical protein